MAGPPPQSELNSFFHDNFPSISSTVHLFAMLPQIGKNPESKHILGAGEKEKRDLMTQRQHFPYAPAEEGT